MATKVKEAFMGEKGLAGTVRKAEIGNLFKLDNIKRVRAPWGGAPCVGEAEPGGCWQATLPRLPQP